VGWVFVRENSGSGRKVRWAGPGMIRELAWTVVSPSSSSFRTPPLKFLSDIATHKVCAGMERLRNLVESFKGNCYYYYICSFLFCHQLIDDK
jgi:hypothetical protein